MTKPIFLLLPALLLLSACGEEEASSNIAESSSSDASGVSLPSSSSSPSWVDVSESDAFLTSFHSSLAKRLALENAGYMVNAFAAKPLLSATIEMEESEEETSGMSASDGLETTEYTISISGDDGEIHSMNRSSAEDYLLSMRFDRLNINLQADGGNPLTFVQGYGAYYARIDEEWGTYLDFSKAAMSAELLSSLAGSTFPSYAYIPETSGSVSLSGLLPLTELTEDLPNAAETLLHEQYALGHLGFYEADELMRVTLTLEGKDQLIAFLNGFLDDEEAEEGQIDDEALKAVADFEATINYDFDDEGFRSLSFLIDVSLDEESSSNIKNVALAAEITPLEESLAIDSSFPNDLDDKTKWIDISSSDEGE